MSKICSKCSKQAQNSSFDQKYLESVGMDFKPNFLFSVKDVPFKGRGRLSVLLSSFGGSSYNLIYRLCRALQNKTRFPNVSLIKLDLNVCA